MSLIDLVGNLRSQAIECYSGSSLVLRPALDRLYDLVNKLEAALLDVKSRICPGILVDNVEYVFPSRRQHLASLLVLLDLRKVGIMEKFDDLLVTFKGPSQT